MGSHPKYEQELEADPANIHALFTRLTWQGQMPAPAA
jgi:hypothetical protein